MLQDEVRARNTAMARSLRERMRHERVNVRRAEDQLGLVITLARSEGMSWDDIGDALDVSGTTAQRNWNTWTKR